MPILTSRYFGGIEYEENSVLEFPLGIPGFEDERRFLAIEQRANRPLVFVQSVACPDLCFATLPVAAVSPGYRLQLSAEDRGALELGPGERPECGRELLCLAILSFHADGPPTANLLSPLVVDVRTRKGVQSVQAESGYSHRHPLVEAAEPVCS
jgi:flagellar assembly factor FliW